MGDQDQIIDGSDSDRSQVEQRETSANPGDQSSDQDGSNGTSRPVEPVAEESPTKEDEEAKELQLAYEFRDHAINLFGTLAHRKYNKGQEEHGGFLPRDVTLKDIEDEMIDNWFYFQAFKSQLYAKLDEKTREQIFRQQRAPKLGSDNPGA